MADLPAGWESAILENVAAINMGQSPPSSTYNNAKNGLPFYQGKAEFGVLYPTAVKYCSEPKKTAQEGDVLISVRAPVGPTNFCPALSCIGRGLAAITSLGGIPNSYLFYFLRYIEPWLSRQGTGSTFTAISGKNLAGLRILVPPLLEQKRIVKKLQTLLPRVDSCRERLDKIPLILKRFRQSVLAAACSEGTPIHLDDILTDIRYGTSKPCKRENIGTPVLRIPNIGEMQISQSDIKYGKFTEKELQKLLLKEGDLLLIRSNGSVSLVGKAAIVSSAEEGFAYAGYLIRLRIDREQALPSYVNLALATQSVREQIEVPARSTSGVHNINAGEVKELEINLPSLEAQQEIVRRVKSLFEMADAVQKRYITGKAAVDNLTQSILAKAFRGELVPQNPDDLPAPQPGKWFVYALQCSNDSIYIGHCKDVLDRWKQHASGRGVDWTKKYPPQRLVHWEEFDSRENAVIREKELKTGFGRKWLKRELAAGRTRQAGEPASVLLERIREKRATAEKPARRRKKTLK